jgi:hypothetical protein
MDLTAMQATLTSLNVATGIVKTLVETKSAVEVRAKVIELQSALLDAQSCAIAATTSQFELQEKVRSLEEQVKTLTAWGDQEKRYYLVCPWRGPAQVYALRRVTSCGEAAHFLCTNCFHGKKRVVLNPVSDKNGFISMVCPSCRASMDTGYRAIGNPKYAEEFTAEG